MISESGDLNDWLGVDNDKTTLLKLVSVVGVSVNEDPGQCQRFLGAVAATLRFPQTGCNQNYLNLPITRAFCSECAKTAKSLQELQTRMSRGELQTPSEASHWRSSDIAIKFFPEKLSLPPQELTTVTPVTPRCLNPATILRQHPIYS